MRGRNPKTAHQPETRQHGGGRRSLWSGGRCCCRHRGRQHCLGRARADLPSHHAGWPVEDMGGRLVTPGLIDCHTHIVFGGNRAREFEMRLEGASYEEIARAGGGIVSTVSATRAASVDELVDDALPRVDHLLAEGVTTLEIKSGYGLDIDTELNMLRAARRIAAERPVDVKTSFLGAHAVPADYRTRRRLYRRGLHARAGAGPQGGVGRCGGRVLRRHCLHARHRSSGCSSRRASWACRSSCTPSNCPTSAGRSWPRSMARCRPITSNTSMKTACGHGRAGTVAVILPGAFYTLRETQLPPIGVPQARRADGGGDRLQPRLLADDLAAAAMNMACTLFRMTPEEALAGVTRNAARALGLMMRHHRAGQAGRPCDVECRAPGRTVLPDRLQPAASADLFGGDA
jgi:imidazolonepropionase